MKKADYLSRIRKEFPDISFSTSKLIEEGVDHDIVLLDKTVVFRFPKQEGYERRLKKEIRLMEKLRKKISVNIPTYTRVASDHSFVGYEYVVGKPLTVEYYNKLSKEKKLQFLDHVGSFLTQLHTFSATKATGLLEPLTIHVFQETWLKNQHIVQSHLRKDRAAFLSRFYTVLPALTKHTKDCLIHSDLLNWHILVSSEGVEGVIDFSDCRYGDPAVDFAWFWNLGQEAVEALYTVYSGPKDGRFLERSKYYYIDFQTREIVYGFSVDDKSIVKAAVSRIDAVHEEMQHFFT